MSRRKSDDTITIFWNYFTVHPWWTCPLFAAVAYLGLAYAVPMILSTNDILSGLAFAPRFLAPFAAGLVLLIGMFAGLSKCLSGRLLDNQSGLDTIDALTWQQFEHLIAAAYRRQGYEVVDTGSGADGGIDLVLRRGGQKSLVQCKHWRSRSVGVKYIRELHGLTHSKEHVGSQGIFVTFGNYTHEARAFANDNGIVLVDRRSLLQMIGEVQRQR